MGFNPLRLRTVVSGKVPPNKIAPQGGARGPVPSPSPKTVSDKTGGGSPEAWPAPKRPPHVWVYGAIAGDWIAAVLGSLIAFWLRFETVMRDVGYFDAKTVQQYGAYLALGSISLICVLAKRGIYHRDALLRSRWVADRLAVGVMIWTAGFLAVVLAFKMEPPVSRLYMTLNGACTLLLLLSWRRLYDRLLRSGKRLAALRRRTLFVGWSSGAAHFSRSLKRDEGTVFEVLGWVDTGDQSVEEDSPAPDLPCLGSIDQMNEILAAQRPDMVVLADLNGPRDQIVELANLCERELVSFKVIPSCFRIFVSGLHLETVAGTPILGVDRLPLDNSFNVLVKRLLDIAGATVGLILSAPIIAFFGALVYLESRGPVLYRQRRVGLNGRPFDIIKIRSMRLNAEAATGATWCAKDDPRRLRVGAFMRKWNIDELPQFWNVLRGEMSLVGPRPERPELIQNFKHEIPHYQARHNAKPGMTGWAQVKGWRGDTDLSERIKCDLWYLENWNLMLDLQILLLTFFRRDNAY